MLGDQRPPIGLRRGAARGSRARSRTSDFLEPGEHPESILTQDGKKILENFPGF